jgi:hypothetical protein
MKDSGMITETPAKSASKGPRYPWGLSISLDDSTIDKLDIDFDTCNVGKEYTATVVLRVTSKNDNERQDRTHNRSISMQITKMAVEKGKFDAYHKELNKGPGE